MSIHPIYISLSKHECCIICGEMKAILFWSKGNKQIVRCPTCGFCFHYPKLSIPDYEINYHKERLRSNYDKKLDIDRLRQVKRLKKRGSLLDVGCGFGKFLELAQSEGYIISGLEISNWAKKIACERIGRVVTKSSIEQAVFKPNSFDIITVWHVLEHLDNPIIALSRLKSWLKPGGLLALEVPNEFNSLIRKFVSIRRGHPAPYTNPPVHLWYFTPLTITKLISRTGWQILGVNTFRFEASNNFYNKYRILRTIAPILDWIVYKFHVGAVIRVFARKVY